MAIETYLAYLAACTVIIVIPGPIVTLVVANSIRHGTRAGLLTVAGNELALGVMIAIVAVGLAQIAATMGWWFDWVRLAGAAYLLWLGWKLIRSDGSLADAGAPPPRHGFFLQGLAVGLSAGTWLSRRRVRLVSRLSGAFLIGGGIWLAVTRSR